ncbi:MAG: 50S ribosomal protein L25 [Desulfotomaculales bacterium]
MVTATLQARTRAGRGRGYRNRLRAKNLLPGVVYGKRVGSIPIEVEARAVQEILAGPGKNALIELHLNDSGGTTKYHAIIKELQYHPVRNELMHIDLQQVALDEEVATTVLLRLVGDAPGEAKGGLVEQVLRSVEVVGRPDRLPEALDVDISRLDVGDSIHIRDLAPPAGIRILEAPEAVVVTVLAPAGAGEEAPQKPEAPEE